MGKKRLTIQYCLAFPAEARGEAPNAAGKGTELPMAKRASGSPAMTEELLEEVCRRENLRKALKRVNSTVEIAASPQTQPLAQPKQRGRGHRLR